MSVKIEQHRSLKYVRELLYDWLDPKKRPKGVEQMRQRIFSAMRHYPPLKEDGEPIWSKY